MRQEKKVMKMIRMRKKRNMKPDNTEIEKQRNESEEKNKTIGI